MENLSGPQRETLINYGKEFAYEGMDPETFKANSPEEMKFFLEGYKSALQEMKTIASEEEKTTMSK